MASGSDPSEIRFVLNGAPHAARGVDPRTTLLHYLRAEGMTGTKEGCAEGECGACAVALKATAPDGTTRYEAVNSCLVLLPSVAGREVVTVEGVARDAELHPAQREMADGGGSQCGYCTPGFVVSLFAEYYRADAGPLDEEAIGGNLCRCTGYRPIRDATTRLAQIRSKEIAERTPDPHRARLATPADALLAVDYRPAPGGPRFVRPASLTGALAARASDPALVLIAGGTDLVVEVNQRHVRHAGYLSLEGIAELRVLQRRAHHLAIGAAVSLAELEERLHRDASLGDWPMLRALLPLFSSRLIRTRATLGGNLGTASPIGDSPPVLLALGAEVVAARHTDAGAIEQRVIPIDAFFLGYRKTALAPDEVITEVRLPLAQPRVQRFYKVSKRKMDDISTVAAAFAIDLGADGRVVSARLAYGGVAATPVRLPRVEASLVGQVLGPASLATAAAIAMDDVKPMDDHRGTARYRQAMVGSLLRKLGAELADAGGAAATGHAAGAGA